MTPGRLLAVLVAVHVGLGLHAAASKTVTHDEFWHLPVGLLHWRTGRFDQDVLNPPLTRLWSALPAALAGVKVEPGVDATDIANKFSREHGQPVHRWYVWGRAFNLVLSVITGLLLCRWARQWWGDRGAVLAGVLYFTSPNILAHAALVTPDVGLTLGFTATLMAFCRWRSNRSWPSALGLGAVLGLTQATKFTAVLLYPLLVLLWAGCGSLPVDRDAPAATSTGFRRFRRAIGEAGCVLALSIVCWNAAFLFEGSGHSLADYPLQSRAMQQVRELIGPLARLPFPLPSAYVEGIDRQRAVMEQPHPSYLDGHWSVRGFPDYFVRTLQYKLPHLLQCLIFSGLVVVCLSRSVADRRARLLVMLLPTISLLGLASASTMQLGVRYVLPVLPLLMLLATGANCVVESLRPKVRSGLIATCAIAAVASLRFHPHHLTYFNELAGGPVGGRYHLLDSNLDWGQDLHLVREFMQERNLDKIGLVYFGTWPAELLGIDYHISTGFRPEPGWHAVSVNYVMGRPHLLKGPGGVSRPADINEFAYFQQFEPVARLGNSIDVYHIDAAAIDPTGPGG